MKKWACNWKSLLLTRFNGYYSTKIWCSPSVVPYRGIYSDSYKQQVWEQAKRRIGQSSSRYCRPDPGLLQRL